MIAASGTRRWWKEGVVYQIYPRSFQDSNGDGIGDLEGVIQRLDYLKELGIDILWLTPFNTSPDKDNGYDISNYYGVDPRYGDLATFDRLIAGCHERGIRFVMDAVLNHSSDQHPWFVESRQSRDNPRRDYYFWRQGKGGGPPNNWSAGFAPSAWTLDQVTGDYYLHYYTASMPDLNWECDAMRAEVHAMLRWWLERGVDGFRLDSINLIKKHTAFPDAINPDPAAPGHGYDLDLVYNRPGLLELLQEMQHEVVAERDILLLGETSNTPAEMALQFVKPAHRALDMVFNFEAVEQESSTLLRLKQIQRDWARVIEQGGWTTQYLSNHDQPRQVSKFGDDGRFRVDSAKALATMLHTLPGTPFVYQGEEIGMSNCAFGCIEDYDDLAAHNRYRALLATGHSPAQALREVQRASRDNARTPMQWTAGVNAGFTQGKPWLPVNANHVTVNVDAALADEHSVFHHYRRLIALRRQHPVLVYGSFEDLLPEDPAVYAYTRALGDARWLVLLNLSGQFAAATLPIDAEHALMLGTHGAPDTHGAGVRLRPWEAAIVALGHR